MVIAFYLVRWAAPHGAMWVVLFVASVAGTFALYEIVRRVRVLRFLFGMRGRTKATPAREEGAA